MSQLILPARLKAQPRGHFEIAQGDPLTRGLIGAFPLASDFDDRVHGLVPSVVSPLPFSVPPSSGVATNWRAPNFSSGNLTFNPTKLAPQVSGNFSLSFWVNIASQSRYNDIFVTSFGSGLYVQLGNGDIIVNIGDNTGTFLANFYVSPTGFGTNKWMHFVVTVAPTVCHVYFNGVDQGANAISGGIPVLIASGFTGAIGNESYHCDGAISNLLLYDRTLSKSDAVELYRNPQHVYRKSRRLFFVSGGGVSASAAQTDGAPIQAATASVHVTASAAQTGGAPIQAATASVHVTASAAQTDGAPIQAATASVHVTASAAQTDGAPIQVANAGPVAGVSASAAQTDGAPIQFARATPIIVAFAIQADGAPIQVAYAGQLPTIHASAAQVDGAPSQEAFSFGFNPDFYVQPPTPDYETTTGNLLGFYVQSPGKSFLA